MIDYKRLFAHHYKFEGKPLILYDYEVRIAEAILNPKYDKVIITATTQIGKTLTAALAINILAAYTPEIEIKILSPLIDNTATFREYIANHIGDHHYLASMLDIDRSKGVDNLRKEVSKKMITFKNKTSIQFLTAEGKAERLLGKGGHVVLVDELWRIDEEVIRTKIMRMKGIRKNFKLIFIGNPLSISHYGQKCLENPKFHKVHINWQDAVNEGALSLDYVNEQKEDLSPIEFQIFYDAVAPKTTEDQLIQYDWIQKALKQNFYFEEPEIIIGSDPAELGTDETCHISVEKKKDLYKMTDLIHFDKEETMQTANRLMEFGDRKNASLYNVDSTGVGAGVFSRLKEKGYKSQRIMTGSSAVEKDRFISLKAETYWNLRVLFEKGKIDIIKDNKLISELLKLIYEVKKGKVYIIDPPKSPNRADALSYGCGEFETEPETIADYG